MGNGRVVPCLKKTRQMTCKPGSVHALKGRWMAIHLVHPLPNASSNRPGRQPENLPAAR